MTHVVPYNEAITNELLLQIAKKHFPEHKIYEQRVLIGKCVFINKNSIFRVQLKVMHAQKINETAVIIVDCATPLGGLTFSNIWGSFAYSKFIKEVEDVFVKELDKLKQ